MAKLRPLGPPTGGDDAPPPGLGLSLEGAQSLIDSALPNLKCPVCGNESFILAKDSAARYGVQIPIYAGAARVPTGRIETLALNCDDCGHVLLFSEDELAKRAERRK